MEKKRPMLKRISLFCIFLLFHSCIGISRSDHSADAICNVELQSLSDIAMQSGDFEEGEWPEYNWWKMFEDEQLNSLVEQAINENPTMKGASEKVQRAYEIAQAQKSVLYPEIDLAFMDNWQHLSQGSLFRFPPSLIPAAIYQLDLSLNFSYEIDLFGKNLNLYRASLGEAKAQAADAAQTMLIISIEVCKEYFNLQVNQQKLQNLNELLRAKVARYDLVKERFIVGLDNQISLLETQQEMFRIEKEIFQIENEIELNRHLLGILLGKGPEVEEIFFVQKPFYDQLFELPENLSLDLISRRADISAQLWHVDAIAKEIGAAKAAFYPNLNLSAFAGLESLSWGNFLSLGNFQGSLAPAIHLPIFTGGRLKANLNEKIAKFNEAIYEYNEKVLQAAKEVADQITSLIAIKRQKLAQEESFLSSEAKLHLRSLRFEEGIDNRLTVLESKEQTLLEKLSLLDLEKIKLFTVLRLIKALGGGYHSPKEIIFKQKVSDE